MENTPSSDISSQKETIPVSPIIQKKIEHFLERLEYLLQRYG